MQAAHPAVVLEVRWIGDRNRYVAHKVDVYLRAGTALVALVDPHERIVVLQDADAMRLLREGERFEHPALPGFAFELAELFAELEN